MPQCHDTCVCHSKVCCLTEHLKHIYYLLFMTKLQVKYECISPYFDHFALVDYQNMTITRESSLYRDKSIAFCLVLTILRSHVSQLSPFCAPISVSFCHYALPFSSFMCIVRSHIRQYWCLHFG